MDTNTALDKFLAQLDADGRSIHTRQQYARHIKLFARWLTREQRDGSLEQLDHEDVATFMNSATARQRADGNPKKPNTTNALRTSVRCFFAYAHAAGWAPTNPAHLLRRAICSPGPPRAMSDDEVARLLATLKRAKGTAARRDHALFTFMLGTGVRLSSALALRVEDVDLDRGEATLRNAKGGRTDVVILSSRIRVHLARYLGDQRSGIVFTGARGQPLSRRHVHRRLVLWAARAGITRPVHPHMMRHSFGMRVYRKTRDLLVTQAALHHRSILSTLAYARTDDQALRMALP